MLRLYRIKTLTTLMIAMNNIGDQGAKYLAEALLFNEVCHNASSFINCSILLLIIDTYNNDIDMHSNW
jgi:hypothetical protein